jgi:UDP-glucose 4-epimerase
MRSLLVTGGCGFIGSHLVDMLVARGHRVRVLDDLSTGKAEHIPSGVDLLAGDVADRATVAQAADGIDGCFHLAAIASVQRCNEDWPGTHRVNLGGHINILDAARQGGFPVVYASSAAVYGDQIAMPLRESASTRPRTPYGADKLGCEQHAVAGAVVHGLRSTGLRFFNVYGPRQQPGSPYSGVISTFADRLARGLPLLVHGDGGQSRDFVFVDDVVAALVRAMEVLDEEPGPQADLANVCTGKAVTITDLARSLMRITGRQVALQYGPAREGDIRCSVGDPAYAERRLHFTAEVELADGLVATYRALARSPAGDLSPASRSS